MEAALGLVGMAIFIAAVIALAAGVTYAIVKISPSTRGEKKPKPSSAAGR